MPAINAVSAAVAVVEWMLLRDFPRFTAVLVFFHLSTSSAVLVSGFWSIINERFDVHSAKRHIGRIGMGATLGGIVGGIVAERTAVYLAPNAILLVLAVMQVHRAPCCSRSLGRGARRHGRPRGTGRRGRHSARGRALAPPAQPRRSSSSLGAVAAGALDYVFKADIVPRRLDAADLLGSLALFYTVTNVVTARRAGRAVRAAVVAASACRAASPRCRSR